MKHVCRLIISWDIVVESPYLVNIHTHLIPFILWSLNLIPIAPFWITTSASTDTELPIYAFSLFSLLCLFTSSLWHTMAGCAHAGGMELCAKVDYVGIGW